MGRRWHAWKRGLTATQIDVVYCEAHELCAGFSGADYLEAIEHARRHRGWIRMPLVGLLRDWQRELENEGAADGRAAAMGE